MDPGRKFGENVRRERMRRGMTQEDLAHAAGVHPTAISRLETSDRNPRFLMIMRVAGALSVKPAKLFEGIG